jgi:hypothetical protein
MTFSFSFQIIDCVKHRSLAIPYNQRMEITCYRDAEWATEQRHLPATTYNLAHTLLAQSAASCLFVPIRSLQYLAILDAEEWVFLDGVRKCWIDIAWRHFHPQARDALDEAVPYQAVYYQSHAHELMPRLHSELPRALHELSAKNVPHGAARVLKFPAPPR